MIVDGQLRMLANANRKKDERLIKLAYLAMIRGSKRRRAK